MNNAMHGTCIPGSHVTAVGGAGEESGVPLTLTAAWTCPASGMKRNTTPSTPLYDLGAVANWYTLSMPTCGAPRRLRLGAAAAPEQRRHGRHCLRPTPPFQCAGCIH